MTCPLCSSGDSRITFAVAGGPEGAAADICQTCADQIEGVPEPNHWRGLAGAIWDENPAVQVLSLRMLRRLADHDWARDVLDQVYLEPDIQAWADNEAPAAPEQAPHKDANGALLAAGDTVVLIKDLPVRGAGFTAKRGTAVRGISLVADNPDQIEGRVEGQRIVILTRFVKRK